MQYVFSYNSTLELGADAVLDDQLVSTDGEVPLRVVCHVVVQLVSESEEGFLLSLLVSNVRFQKKIASNFMC